MSCLWAARKAGPGRPTISGHFACARQCDRPNDGSVCAPRFGSAARMGEGRHPSPVPPTKEETKTVEAIGTNA